MFDEKQPVQFAATKLGKDIYRKENRMIFSENYNKLIVTTAPVTPAYLFFKIAICCKNAATNRGMRKENSNAYDTAH